MPEIAKFQSRYSEDRNADFSINGGIGGWIIIRETMVNFNQTLSFILKTSGGTGRIEVTYDDINTVKTGSPEVEAWPAGDVSAFTTAEIPNYITAWRVISTAGIVTGQARGKF